MKFKLEHIFEISDEVLLIDANDGQDTSEEYRNINEIPNDLLEEIAFNYLEGIIEHMTLDEITVNRI